MKALERTLVAAAFFALGWLIILLLVTFVDISFSWMDLIRRVM